MITRIKTNNGKFNDNDYKYSVNVNKVFLDDDFVENQETSYLFYFILKKRKKNLYGHWIIYLVGWWLVINFCRFILSLSLLIMMKLETWIKEREKLVLRCVHVWIEKRKRYFVLPNDVFVCVCCIGTIISRFFFWFEVQVSVPIFFFRFQYEEYLSLYFWSFFNFWIELKWRFFFFLTPSSSSSFNVGSFWKCTRNADGEKEIFDEYFFKVFLHLMAILIHSSHRCINILLLLDWKATTTTTN